MSFFYTSLSYISLFISFHFISFQIQWNILFELVATVALNLLAGIELLWQFAIDAIAWKLAVDVAVVAVEAD